MNCQDIYNVSVSIRKVVKLVTSREREPKGRRPLRLRIVLPKVNPEEITVPKNALLVSRLLT